MTKKASFAIWILSALILLSACTNTQQASTVRIAYLPIINALPLYVALEKGYFEDAGIIVEAVKFESPNQIIDALLANQVDIGAPSTASAITAISQNKKPDTLKIFAIVGGDETRVNDVLLVQKDSSIKSISELRGKKLGVLPGIQWKTTAKYVLAQNGLEADKDVTLIELAVPLQIPALASGQIDALLSIEPAGTIGKGKGVARDLIPTPLVQYIAKPYYGGVGVVNVKFAAEHPDVSSAVIEVFRKTIGEIMQDPEAHRQYLKGYTALDAELIGNVPLAIWKMQEDITDHDISALQAFFDIFMQYGVIDGKVDARSLIYSPSR